MTRPAVRRLLWTFLVAAALALTFGVAPRETAEAADLSGFEPGLLISDSIFYDSTTMSAAQVQSFLDARGAGCVPASGSTCLKDFRQTTSTRAADDRCTGTYTGAANETAAQIITKVAVACGINPQVLIVTLQKEQGLVTASAGRSEAVYRKATGYGCPDTAPCDAQYYGFFNQVYNTAHQFQNYAARPTSYAHRAGMWNQVRYHPDAACGSGAVYIQNQATASLYNYTPYQPNARALAAGYGTGDSCSSYGNRNFWNYFTDWFGSTTQRAPIGNVDSVTSPSVGTIRVAGWALDPDTTASISVHVYVDGKAVQAIRATGSRPDVGRAYGKGEAHGFSTTVSASSGTHQVCVYAIDSTGGPNTRIGCRDVQVVNATPVGVLDAVTSPASGTVRLRGWALDPDTTASISVHVYVDGKAVQAARATGSRPDVGRAYGKGDQHGFDLTLTASKGTHQVCVYALDSTGGANPRIGCRTVSVDNKLPIGSLDSATSVQGRLQVRGWVLDPDTTNPIAAHVYVDGTAVRSVRADGSRPDVGRVHGKGDAHGFSTILDVSLGQHQVCVYAIDSTGGTNPRIGCTTVTVTNATPRGHLDSVTTGMDSFTAQGWALDPDGSDSLDIRISVDGTAVQTAVADASRPDIDRIYGLGSAHGFSLRIAAAPGRHEVCLDAADSWSGALTRIGCSTVDVNGTAFGAVDAVSTSAGTVRVRGWTIDPNTTDPINVHLYVDGVAAAAVRADGSRPDVDRVYGMGAAHGFDRSLAVASGRHDVCVYAIDSWNGTNPLLACRSVVVP